MQQSAVFEDREDVLTQALDRHVPGVAAGDQQVGHLGMLAQVGVDLVDVFLDEHVLVTAHLRVAEAVGAEREALLRRLVEDQHARRVLVLAALDEVDPAVVQLDPGLVEELVAVVGVRLVDVVARDARPLLRRRLGGVALEQVLSHHPRLGKHELEHRIALVVLPVDAVQRVTRRLEPVDLHEQLALGQVAEVDAVLREDRDDLPEPREPGVVITAGEQHLPPLEKPGVLRVCRVEPAEQPGRQQVLGLR